MNKKDLCLYDEAFSIKEMEEETGQCEVCKITECPNCEKHIGKEDKDADCN